MSRGRGIPCPTVCLLNSEEEERRLQGMNYRLEGEEEEEEDSGEAVIMMYRMGEEEVQ